MNTTRCVWWTTVLLALMSLARADSVVLQPSADTTLFETAPGNNLGGDVTFVAGTTAQGLRNRALIRFDLTGHLPPGATIVSAALGANVVKASTLGAKPSTFELHRVLVSWGEGNKTGSNGAPAGTGEATWQARSFPATLWSTPGGASGIDFATEASAAANIDLPGAYDLVSAAPLVNDVQSWLDHPESNFGWILLSQAESTPQTARRFASREAGLNGPILTIQFTPPAQTVRILSLTMRKTNGVLTWAGPAAAYQVQTSSNLGENDWTNLGPVLSTQTISFPRITEHACFRILQVATNSSP